MRRLVLLPVALLLIAGCTSSSDGQPSATDTPTTATSATATPTAKPGPKEPARPQH